jgi:glycosyltransferase involved in cell wall biosynthesis
MTENEKRFNTTLGIQETPRHQENLRKSASATVSIVLGTYNRKEFLKEAIQSIRQNGITVPYEIIAVDGGSTDGSTEWLIAQPDIITIVQHNRSGSGNQVRKRKSWGYFMNLGFKCAEGEYIVMISDDSLLVPGAVMNGVRHCETLRQEGRNVGAVAFYWRNWPEQQEYWVGLTHGEKMFVNHGLYVRTALQEVAWIDEDRYQFYCADGDLCLKLWEQSYEVVDCPTSFVEHFSHANLVVRQSNLESERTDRTAYEERWRGIFFDPSKPNTRDWIYLAHEDTTRTAERFTGSVDTLSLTSLGKTHGRKRFTLRNLWSA